MYYNYYEEFETLISQGGVLMSQGETIIVLLAVLVALGVVRASFEIIRYVRGLFKKNV